MDPVLRRSWERRKWSKQQGKASFLGKAELLRAEVSRKPSISVTDGYLSCLPRRCDKVQANRTVGVFCSYALEDENWLHELEAHLSLSKRQGLLTLWYSHLISPGTNKQQVIDTHLETADVILLLVSADFLASDCAPCRCI